MSLWSLGHHEEPTGKELSYTCSSYPGHSFLFLFSFKHVTVILFSCEKLTQRCYWQFTACVFLRDLLPLCGQWCDKNDPSLTVWFIALLSFTSWWVIPSAPMRLRPKWLSHRGLASEPFHTVSSFSQQDDFIVAWNRWNPERDKDLPSGSSPPDKQCQSCLLTFLSSRHVSVFEPFSERKL